MTVTSKQESILNEIETVALPLIDGTGHYNLSLGKISRRMIDYTKLSASDFPAVCIMDESDVSFTLIATPFSMTTGRSPGNIEDGWQIALVGWVKSEVDTEDEGLLQKEMIKLQSDLMIAMMIDPTRGGYAKCTIPIGQGKRIDYINNTGEVIVIFSIKYDFNPKADTPTT